MQPDSWPPLEHAGAHRDCRGLSELSIDLCADAWWGPSILSLSFPFLDSEVVVDACPWSLVLGQLGRMAAAALPSPSLAAAS